MRKIEVEMLQAVCERRSWRSANTRVEVISFAHSNPPLDRVNVYLHDNLIACVTPKSVTINDCGWQSPTTKSRLNALLSELCNVGIYQRNKQWFCQQGEIVQGPLESWQDYTLLRVA
jgi:hypothetical protein